MPDAPEFSIDPVVFHINPYPNYAGDAGVAAKCRACTALIDARIDARMPELTKAPNRSLISTQLQAGLRIDRLRSNVKLAISGGRTSGHHRGHSLGVAEFVVCI